MSLIVTEGLGDSGVVVVATFQGTGIVSSLNNLEVQTTEIPTVTGPAADPSQYTITPLDGGIPATVTAVSISGTSLELTTTVHSGSKNYSVTLPSTGMISTISNVYQGPFTFNYVGVGIPPLAILARSIDSRTLEIAFTAAMVESEALNPIHYSISPPVAVFSVVKVLDSIFRLTTGRQERGVSYSVTVSGIHDIYGNLI